MSLYEGTVRKPIITLLCFLTVVIFGLFSLSELPIGLYPNIDANTIMVTTAHPGTNASDVENNVTRPLENISDSIGDLEHITSRSSENISLIMLEFEFGNNIDVLMNDVRDKLDMISSELPGDVGNPIIFRFSTDMIPTALLSVQANESQSTLYKILGNRVVNPLTRIPGVGMVSTSSAPQRETQVYCDPCKLEAYNPSIETISSIVGAENGNIPGGNFDTGNEAYSLRVEDKFDGSGELTNVVVGTYNGAAVYLYDVAKIVDTVKERAQETYNNGMQGAMIVVQKQSGANSMEISKRAQDTLPHLRKNLSSGVKLEVIVDTSEDVLSAIDSLTETVMYALLFVMIAVFLFLGYWRTTLIICIATPLSLIASSIYLTISGSMINIISLSPLSIAIGMVVNDAIVVLENVTTHIECGSDPKQASVHGTSKVAISAVASTLMMIAVFFPLMVVTGMSGVLFRQLGWMTCAIMFVSTVPVLTLTPMLCSQLLRLQRKQSKVFRVFFGPVEHALGGLDNWYARMLNWAVRHRMVVLAGCVVFFILSLLCAEAIGTGFFPAQDNARIAVQLELPTETRKEVARGVSEKLTKRQLRRYKDTVKVCNYAVRQADSDNTWAPTQDNGSHIIFLNISLVDPSERNVTLETVCNEMREDLKAYPKFNRTQVISGGSSTGISTQASADLEVYGYSMGETDSVVARLKHELLKVKGVSEISISRSDYQPEYRVDFNREKLALHGLNLSTAVTYLRNRINSATTSKYREDGGEYDIKVRYAPEYRTSLKSIESILVYNAKGGGVHIKDLRKVVECFALPTAERKDRERIVTVSAIISGAPLGDVVATGNTTIDRLEKPLDIAIQVSGSFEDQQGSFRDLGTSSVLIAVLVFIVVTAQFESLAYPLILTLSVPFAMSGVLMALFTISTTLSAMSLLDSIMLIGIVVKNGIVLIDYTAPCRERGQSVLNTVVTTGKGRLRPVLMTTMTTILGMIPMAVSAEQGSEMWSPMATAVIGGLAVSTILTLIYVPTVYCIFGGVSIKRQRRKMHERLDAYFKEQGQTNS